MGFVGISLIAHPYADTSDSIRISRQNTLVGLDVQSSKRHMPANTKYRRMAVILFTERSEVFEHFT